MKVRWTAGSLRLRITPSEMEAIRLGDVVSESVVFDGRTVWRVEVLPSDSGSRLEAGQDAVIAVRLSEEDRAILLQPDAEGVYLFDDDVQMRFLVEKDFPCIHPRAAEAAERPTETFAPPPGFEDRKNREIPGQ